MTCIVSLPPARLPNRSVKRAVTQRSNCDLTLVIPAYNEAQRLPRTLSAVRQTLASWQLNFEVIVVDDGSADGTATLPAQFGGAFRTLRLARNQGKGAAVRAGMLRAAGEVIAFTDADLPFDLGALRLAYELVCDGRADVVCGGRDLPESRSNVSRSYWRRLASRAFRTAVSQVVPLKVCDTQCGLKVFSREAAQRVFSCQHIDGLAFDVEVLFLAERLGLSCVRIPVVQLNENASTISLRRHAVPMLIDLFRIRWLHRNRFDNLTVDPILRRGWMAAAPSFLSVPANVEHRAA